jgi:hypothetical protein
MDARYNRATGSLNLCFHPWESWEVAVLMQLVWEEEWQKGTTVPDFSEDFFKQLAVSREKIPLEFDFEYLEFAIAFLEEACAKLTGSDSGMTVLEKFVLELREYCSGGQKIH